MSVKHTPGIWYWTQQYRGSDNQPAWSLIGANGYGILSCDAANAPQDLGATGAADARLIAAAPELLEALQGHIDAVNLMNAALKDGINVHGALSALIAAEDNARAAIAKASPSTTADAGVVG